MRCKHCGVSIVKEDVRQHLPYGWIHQARTPQWNQLRYWRCISGSPTATYAEPGKDYYIKQFKQAYESNRM